MTDPLPEETKNTTLINNEWITLLEKRNGVDVQRAFAGIYPMVTAPNAEGKSEVTQCIVYYHERELYPNGSPIKTVLKSYRLVDLPFTEFPIGDQVYTMEPLAVLTGFVNSLGYPGIINPARETLADTNILPLDVADRYPLRLLTREKTLKK